MRDTYMLYKFIHINILYVTRNITCIPDQQFLYNMHVCILFFHDKFIKNKSIKKLEKLEKETENIFNL